MKFEPGMICKTRDGREVEILKVDAPGPRPIVGLVLSGFNKGEAQSWYADGLYGTGAEFYFGLLPPETRSDDKPERTREVMVWVNVYESAEECFTTGMDAKRWADEYALAVAVPVTFTVEY